MSAKSGGTPLSLHDFMGAANAAYYNAADPLGRGGDFITAPEISQMFGELIGLWCADLWQRAGAPADAIYVEPGPGRGTLAADALRAMAKAGLQPEVHFVEISAALRAEQARMVPNAHWHDTVETLPEERPLLIVANEFFDALPIRQFIRTGKGWREHLVVNGRLEPGEEPADDAIPLPLADALLGSVVERNPGSEAIMAFLSERIARQGGAMLAIDYGYEGPATGDTLQAVMNHKYADPFENPGSRDLTAHVDFAMLAAIAQGHGLRTSPIIGQGPFLRLLGIEARAKSLSRANPNQSNPLLGQVKRLTAEAEMGRLFKVLSVRHRDWPMPAGFA